MVALCPNSSTLRYALLLLERLESLGLRHISVELSDSKSEQSENDVESVTMLLRADKDDGVIAESSSEKRGQNCFLEIFVKII